MDDNMSNLALLQVIATSQNNIKEETYSFSHYGRNGFKELNGPNLT